MEKPVLENEAADRTSSYDLPIAVPSSPCPNSINEKALMRKIDLRVIPMLFLIAFSSFLDRVNISNALTMSLPADLGLGGVERNVALTIFFIPYILFEIPSNILMKRFRPNVWLPGCILTFGIVMVSQGFVTTYRGLLVTRFFLGIAEAGIFPGSCFLISTYYKREDSQKRFAVHYCSTVTATVCGGLLASAIAKMDGIRGIHNWRWIFILEGVFTVIVGIFSFFLVADFPENAKWLNEEERNFVVNRAKCTDEIDVITPRVFLQFFKDTKNVLAAIMYFCLVIPLYAFAYFTPTIIKTFGYSIIQTQLHSVPPLATALVFCLAVSCLSDRLKIRSPFIAFGITLSISGLAILMTIHHNFSLQYAGICLVAMGIYSCAPLIICWYVMNLRSNAERAIGAAWLNSIGNCGGFVATFSFLQTQAPYYFTGYTICMVAICLCGGTTFLYGLLVWREKRTSERDAGENNNAQYYCL